MRRLISIVIPCLNERDNLPVLMARLQSELPSEYSYEVVIVDDGSTDDTLEVLKALQLQYPFLKYISLSRNFGHQQALKAGLDNTQGDAVITMDADLQHPPQISRGVTSEVERGL